MQRYDQFFRTRLSLAANGSHNACGNRSSGWPSGFDGQYVERTGLVVQRRRAREGIPERPKEVHSNGGGFVNQLQQGLAFNCIGVDMMQKEGPRDRVLSLIHI